MTGTKINREIQSRLDLYEDMVLEIEDRIKNDMEGSFNSLLGGEDLDFLYELKDAMDTLEGIGDISFIKFDADDVVRHKLVGKIVRAYDEKESRNS